MRYMALFGLFVLAGCASAPTPPLDTVADQVAESKAAFDRTIPDSWSPDNFPIRVIADYKVKGAVGIVAMDLTNTITTFELCGKRTKKCYDNAATEAVANCENTVHLGLQFNILTNIAPKCRVVIVNDKFVHRGKITINGIEYTKGNEI